MIDEQLEFQISQYADGTLPESERALVELRLLSSAEARDLLAEYQSLDGALKSAMPLPAVNWDRLSEHLSDAVDAQRDARAATVLGRIGNWGRSAIAACLVIGMIGVLVWIQSRSTITDNSQVSTNPATPPPHTIVTETPPPRPAAVVVLRGPTAEASASAPVVVVKVGPSPSAAEDNWRIAEDVVTGPSRAVWIASSDDAAQDTERLPY